MTMFLRCCLVGVLWVSLCAAMVAARPVWSEARFDVWTWPSLVQQLVEHRDRREQLLARQHYLEERSQRLDAAVLYFASGEIELTEATARVRRIVRRSEWLAWADCLDIAPGSDEVRLQKLVRQWAECFEKQRRVPCTSCSTPCTNP